MVSSFRWLAPLVLVGTAACNGNGQTTVVGDALLLVDPSTTEGFQFAQETILPPDDGSSNANTVGRCVLGATFADIALARPAAESGLQSIQVDLMETGTPPIAHVTAERDGQLYEADCDLDVRLHDPKGGVFSFSASCTLMAPVPTAQASIEIMADLEFDRCRVY